MEQIPKIRITIFISLILGFVFLQQYSSAAPIKQFSTAVTKKYFAESLGRSMNIQASANTSCYKDLIPNDLSTPYVCALKEAGIFPKNTKFRPNDPTLVNFAIRSTCKGKNWVKRKTLNGCMNYALRNGFVMSNGKFASIGQSLSLQEVASLLKIEAPKLLPTPTIKTQPSFAPQAPKVEPSLALKTVEKINLYQGVGGTIIISTNGVLLLQVYSDDPVKNPQFSMSLYYSEDQGTTWHESSGLPSMQNFPFTVDSINPQLVYAVAANKFYRSEDSGKTFRNVGTISTDVNFMAASIFADRFTTRKIYIGHHNIGNHSLEAENLWGLYVSNDGGDTFSYSSFRDSVSVPFEDESITKNRIIWDINQDPQNPNIIYTTSEQGTHVRYHIRGEPNEFGQTAHYDNYYVVRSLDGGVTWEAFSSGLTWHSLVLEPFIRNGITEWLAVEEGGQSGTYILNTISSRWDKLFKRGGFDYEVSKKKTNVHFLSTNSDRYISDEMYISKDYGKTWEVFFPHSESNDFSSLASDRDGNLYVSDIKQGLFKIPNAVNYTK